MSVSIRGADECSSSHVRNILSEGRFKEIDRGVNPGFYSVMGADQHHDWQSEAASALQWWADAGVDTLVEDTAHDWLRRAETKVDVAAEPEAAPLPDSIAAFLDWRVGSDAPEAGWSAPPIASPNVEAAKLFVLVDMPEAQDSPDTGLLSGKVGRLFDRMLAAIGYDRSSIVLSALALARPISGRIPAEAEARLAEIACHHIGLTGAERVLILGAAASRAMFGADAPAHRGRLDAINHKGRNFPAVATYHPRFLLEHPAAKGDAWRDLQLLMGGHRA